MTKSNIDAAENLRRVWDRFKSENKVPQTQVSLDLNWSEGVVGQHLNKHVAMNVEAILKYAGYFSVSPYDIAADFDDMIGGPKPFILADPLEIRLVRALREASPDDRKFIAEFLDRLAPFDPPNEDAPDSPTAILTDQKTRHSKGR